MLEEALETGEFVTGKINNRVKGGFAVEVDVVKAFLPGSLVDVRPVKEAPDIENTIQEFKVIKLDPTVYFMEYVPIKINFTDVAVLNLSAIVLSLFVLYLPTIYIGKVSKVKQ